MTKCSLLGELSL